MRAMIPDRARPIVVVDDDAKIVRHVRTALDRQRWRGIEAFDGSAMSAIDALESAVIARLDTVHGTYIHEVCKSRSDIHVGRPRGTGSMTGRHPRPSTRSGARRSDVSLVRHGASAADGPR